MLSHFFSAGSPRNQQRCGLMLGFHFALLVNFCVGASSEGSGPGQLPPETKGSLTARARVADRASWGRAGPRGTQDLSSPTRDRTQAPCLRNLGFKQHETARKVPNGLLCKLSCAFSSAGSPGLHKLFSSCGKRGLLPDRGAGFSLWRLQGGGFSRGPRAVWLSGLAVLWHAGSSWIMDQKTCVSCAGRRICHH